MSAQERRYVALGLASSAGVGFVLAWFLDAYAFLLYVALYMVVYDQFSWIHETLERLSVGKEKK